MNQIDLIYVHVACPKCKQNTIPLSAWVIPCDYDEDGHSNGIEVDTIKCHACGDLGEEAKAVCENVIDAMYHLHDYRRGMNLMVEIGTIYSYYPELVEIPQAS